MIHIGDEIGKERRRNFLSSLATKDCGCRYSAIGVWIGTAFEWLDWDSHWLG